jgi:hypothetical protein
MTMTIKLEAAYHEAGHVVLAHLSKFHGLGGSINLGTYGAGIAPVCLSRSKLVNCGKTPDRTSRLDKEVAKDLAVILCAGLVAEQMAAEIDPTLTADAECAMPDHEFMRQELTAAGLSRYFDRHEQIARELLIANWKLVNTVAVHLFTETQLSLDELIAILASGS